MVDQEPIRGVMLDSGGVLTRPVGGRWNPRHDFEAILLRHVPDAPQELFPTAFAAGEEFLETTAGTPPRAQYHRVVLDALGVTVVSQPLLAELEAPAATPPLELFPDVIPTLERLRAQDVRLCVVSNNWAGLIEVYEQLGIAHFFDSVVVSEVLGRAKPDPRTYDAGRRSMNLSVGACLFVDDDPDLVRAAVALGYRAVVLDRGTSGPPTAATVHSLEDVVTLVEDGS